MTLNTTVSATDEPTLAEMKKRLKLMSLSVATTRHDMINDAMILTGYWQIIKDEVLEKVFRENNNEEAKRIVSKIDDSIDRLVHHVKFTKEYEPIGRESSIWQAIAQSFQNSANEFSNQIEVIIENAAENIAIRVDRLFEKVCYVLIDNAIRHGKATRLTVITHCDSENNLNIVVEDNGCGINPAEKSKIFKQGFGKNTGQGLFLATEILAINDIIIWEDGKPGHGARFVMRVPPQNHKIISPN
jgi:signal transduction histidine kinase